MPPIGGCPPGRMGMMEPLGGSLDNFLEKKEKLMEFSPMTAITLEECGKAYRLSYCG